VGFRCGFIVQIARILGQNANFGCHEPGNATFVNASGGMQLRVRGRSGMTIAIALPFRSVARGASLAILAELEAR
jgi:hypothetical protein